jgi:hypothetical protein
MYIVIDPLSMRYIYDITFRTRRQLSHDGLTPSHRLLSRLEVFRRGSWWRAVPHLQLATTPDRKELTRIPRAVPSITKNATVRGMGPISALWDQSDAQSATPEKRPHDKQFENESPNKPTCTWKPLDSLEEPGSLELVQQSNVPCGAENLAVQEVLPAPRRRKSPMRQKAAQNILLQFTFAKFPQKPFHIQWPTAAV